MIGHEVSHKSINYNYAPSQSLYPRDTSDVLYSIPTSSYFEISVEIWTNEKIEMFLQWTDGYKSELKYI